MTNNIQGPSAAALQAMADIEARMRADFQKEVGKKPTPKPAPVINSEPQDFTPEPAQAIRVAEHYHDINQPMVSSVGKINGTTVQKVRRPNTERLTQWEKQRAAEQLKLEEEREAALEAQRASDPVRLQADLAAKERIIKRLQSGMKSLEKRLAKLEEQSTNHHD